MRILVALIAVFMVSGHAVADKTEFHVDWGDGTVSTFKCQLKGKGPSGPIYEANVRRVLDEAGVNVTAVNITPGGCCHWHAVVAIRPLPGDGKNAITAALSVADMKHVTVVDEDIDVFDHVDVEWAVATRVQADRDVVIISGARSKPLARYAFEA